MRILLSDAGKRFNRDWIFRHLTFEFLPCTSYAVIGPNGSGKSTLLQVLCGSLEVSEGKINWVSENLKSKREGHENENIHRYSSLAAPYLEVVEEMTALEFLTFHKQFKDLLPGISIKEVISLVDLQKAAHKQIRYYSSGMKQRIKLAQAIFSDVPLLLLDEPCTNLDEKGYDLYNELITKYCMGKTVIVSSNDINEYSFCTEKINILDYKKLRE